MLCDVSAIGDEQLQRPKSSGTSNAKTAQGKRVDDAAGSADADDDSEPKPDGQSSTAGRPRRQEHERVVIARLNAERQLRGHGQRRARARA